MVLLLCDWELLDLEGLRQHRQYLSTLHLCAKQHDCWLSCRFCSHPLPKGRSPCNKILLLLFSVPFQTMYSVCCVPVQREAAQSRVPCSLVGSGMFGGCLNWEELVSLCRQKAERTAGHGCVLEGCSPSHTLPLLRSLQIITIIIQK